MKLVIFTNKNSNYGKRVIYEFHQAGIISDALIIIKQPPSYYLKLFSYVKRRVGLIESLVFSLIDILQTDKLEMKDFRYSTYCESIIYTDGTNTERTENILKEVSPDIIFLAQTGIVRQNILSVPKKGTLNAHPGILPYYRGIDCFKWAILNEEYDKIGSTLHWVDAGIDTGNILDTKIYNMNIIFICTGYKLQRNF